MSIFSSLSHPHTAIIASVRGFLLASSLFACLCTSVAALAEPPQDNAVVEQIVAKVNINNDDAATLAKHLKGIGLSKATAIVVWREQHGAFSSVDQLMDIKGIGKATIDKNKGLISL